MVRRSNAEVKSAAERRGEGMAWPGAPSAVFRARMNELRRGGKRIRHTDGQEAQEWPLREPVTLEVLARRLEALGHPIHPNVLAKIERGLRKLTLDEAVAIAAALRVPLPVLLLPSAPEAQVAVTRTALVERWRFFQWLARGEPLPDVEDNTDARLEALEMAWPIHAYLNYRGSMRDAENAESAIRTAEYVQDEGALRAAKRAYLNALHLIVRDVDRLAELGLDAQELEGPFRADLIKFGIRKKDT